VSPLRVVLIVCGVLALTGCGSSKTSNPAKPEPASIEAIDEPAEVVDYASLVKGTDLFSCDHQEPDAREDCEPTPEQVEKLRRDLRELVRTYQPAKGSEPRAIARLRLSAPDSRPYARLVAWHNQSGRLCVQTELEDATSSPDGPCLASNPCGKLCVELSESGEGGETPYVLSGIVDSKADGLRITFDDGEVVTYELTGPVVPGFLQFRVLMLDLGRKLDRRLELLRDDETIAEERRLSAEIKEMRCEEDFPPALPTQDSEGRASQLDECLRRAGAQ
jgi:hypothetical protein